MKGPQPSRLLQKGVGRRLLLLFVSTSLVPVAALAILALGSVTNELERQTQLSLRQEAKSFAMSLLERLELLDLELALTLERGLPETRSATRTDRGLEEIGRIDGGSQSGDVEGSPELSDDQRRELALRGRILLVRPGEPRARILLVRRASSGALAWGAADLDRLWAVGSTLPPRTELAVLGAERPVLVSSDFPLDLLDPLRARSREASSGAFDEPGSGGHLVAYWSIPMHGNFGTSNWVVALARPRREALLPVREFRALFPLVMLLALLAASLAATTQLRRSIGPLQDLASASDRVARGDFGVLSDIPAADEIGALASSFATMADRLRGQFAALTTNSTLAKAALEGETGERLDRQLLEGLAPISDWSRATLQPPDGGAEIFWDREQGILDREPPASDQLERDATVIPIPGSESGGSLSVFGGAPDGSPTLELLRDAVQHYALVRERASMSKALEAQRLRLAALLEQVPYGVVVISEEGATRIVNETARRGLSELGDGDPERGLARLLAEVASHVDVSEGPATWLRVGAATELERRFEVAERMIPALGQGVGERLVVFRDVTAEVEAEVSRQRQERLAAVGQLAAGIAHDMNNLLQGLGMCTDLLLEEPFSEIARGHLDLQRDLHLRASSLIRQILDFSSRSPDHSEVILLIEELQRIEVFLRRTLPSSIDLRLDVDRQASLLAIRFDRTQLHQVITNLALNARDAMPAGGNLTIHVRSVERQGVEGEVREQAVIEVRDEGTGMPPEVVARAFDPFFSTKEAGRGTGLGLSQVYGLVAQHRGTVEIASVPNAGTTVRIWLPAAPSPATAATANPSVPTPHRRGLRVLIAEDEPVIRRLLRRLLEASGAEVSEASDGREAMQRIDDAARPFELVISDVGMPHVDGAALLAHLRDHAPATRVILMSGYARSEAGEHRPEPDAWLPKPFSRDQLAAAILKSGA